VRRGLEAEGFTVDFSADGVEGEWLATEGSFDVIVLDIMPPGRNGYQVCANLREAGVWTPILMVTAKHGELDEAEALDTGAHYPGGVLGGLALGGAVAGLGAWTTVPLLTRLVDRLATSPLRVLVRPHENAPVATTRQRRLPIRSVRSDGDFDCPTGR
jgi:CheY-like chemotaxis protein